MKNSDIGTFLDGVAATSDLDTSGERIDIKGIDISSLPIDGLLNWEHKNESGSQIIGKIVEAKKIMKESDCTNERHKHFWEVSRKKPFLYIIAVLFDKVGHSSASDVAAMLNFDKKIDTGETRGTGWFSIEGSRLGKEGSNITKCIARKIAFTNLPCNRSCVAELLEDPDKHCRQISKKKIEESMKKSLQEETDLLKAEPRKYFKELGATKEPKGASYSKITPATGEFRPGKEIKPERTFTSQTAPDKMKVGDRIVHDKKQPKGGKAFYRDLYKDLENPIRKAIMKKDIKKAKVDEGKAWGEKRKDRRVRNEDRSQKGVHQQIKIGESGESKARAYKAPPSVERQLPGTTASYKKRSLDAHNQVISEQKQMPKPNLPKSETPSKKEILKSLASEAWDSFKHKDLLIESIKKTEPELEDNEILGIAKTYAYIDMKKKESEISDMFEKDELEKARVDEKKPKKQREVKNSSSVWGRYQSNQIKDNLRQKMFDNLDSHVNKLKTKKSESEKEEDLNKARVDEGKTGKQKKAARAIRNKDLEEKGVHKPVFNKPIPKMNYKVTDKDLKDSGRSAAGVVARQLNHRGATPSAKARSRELALERHKKVSDEQKQIKPNLPKSEDLNKAKVDEGKSPAMKQVARAYRNKRLKIKKPDGSYKITGTPKEPKKND